MAIIRAPRPDTGWYALDRAIAADGRLSWAARGLLIYLLTKPDHWRVSVAHLQKETAEARVHTGRDGIYALLGELESAGYLVRQQARGEDGRMGETDYQVSEAVDIEPLTAEPLPAEPHTAAATLDKIDIKIRQKDISTPRPAAASSAEVPEWIPAEAWEAFVEMRRKIRAPLTPRAIARTVSELQELRALGQDPEAVLWQSVQRAWRGVFAVKQAPAVSGRSKVEDSNAAALEEYRRRIAAEQAGKGMVDVRS